MMLVVVLCTNATLWLTAQLLMVIMLQLMVQQLSTHLRTLLTGKVTTDKLTFIKQNSHTMQTQNGILSGPVTTLVTMSLITKLMVLVFTASLEITTFKLNVLLKHLPGQEFSLLTLQPYSSAAKAESSTSSMKSVLGYPVAIASNTSAHILRQKNSLSFSFSETLHQINIKPLIISDINF